MKNIVLMVLVFFTVSVFAQQAGSYYNPKDDKYRLLGLKRAKQLFELAEAEYGRQKQLFEKQLISSKTFEKAKSVFADAEVNYQQSLLAVIFEKQYVSVVKAIKYQTDKGKKRVKLTLANTSSGGGEFKKLLNVDDELFRSLQPEVVNDVYISLLNNRNEIISLPYEAKVEQIIFGKDKTIDFELLQDVDAVTVNIIYGNGTQRAPKIYLQKDATENKVVFQSDQFSQEVDLGKEATFNMSLELFSGEVNTYKLQVVNLPKQIRNYFVDPNTNARLSQFKFTQSSQTKNAGLKVFLPDRPMKEVKIDKPIPFYVLALPNNRVQQLNLDLSKNYTLEEIEKMGIGYLKLELIPRGIGELIVKAQQLYFSVLPGEEIEIPFDVLNEGSRRLDNVEFQTTMPLNWTKKITPALIDKLDIREEKRIVLTAIPPEDVGVGKYEIRLKSTSLTDDKLERAEDKIITIEIQPEANVFGTLLLILLILGLVAGIIIFGIKLTRK